MKDSGACGKCRGQNLLRIAGTSGAHGSGNNIPVGMTIFSSVNPQDLAKLVEKFQT